MDKENILLNPDFNLDQAILDSENKKKKAVVVEQSVNAKNMLDARFDKIRSYLQSRSDKLVVVFNMNVELGLWEVGLMTPWVDPIYGVPGDNEATDVEFAKALYAEWEKACNMGQKAFQTRHVLTGGKIREP